VDVVGSVVVVVDSTTCPEVELVDGSTFVAADGLVGSELVDPSELVEPDVQADATSINTATMA